MEGNRNIKFDIKLWGNSSSESFLLRIRAEFEETNLRFENLIPKELIPCICATCRRAKEPHYYDLSLLMQFKRKGTNKKQCPESADDVAISDLLRRYDHGETNKETIDHLNQGKIRLESVLDNKGYLLNPTILEDIKKNISEFETREYFAAAKSLYPNIEHIVNQLLKQIEKNPPPSAGLNAKIKELQKEQIITEEVAGLINTTTRNKLLHGNMAPSDQNECKLIAELCMRNLSDLIECLKEPTIY